MKKVSVILIGCFGNHPYDRAMERQLDAHLSEMDELEKEIECANCGEIFTIGEYLDNNECCPHCGEPMTILTEQEEKEAAYEDYWDGIREERMLNN